MSRLLRRVDAAGERHAVLELDHDVLDVLVDDLDVLADIGHRALAERGERVARGPHADDLERGRPCRSGRAPSATCCDAIENPPIRIPGMPFFGSRLSTTLPEIENARSTTIVMPSTCSPTPSSTTVGLADA